jgi:hypothetical protein
VLCYATIEGAISSMNSQQNKAEETSLALINHKLKTISFSKDRRVVSHSKAKLASTHFAGHNLWILKPTGFNRGRGVSVFDTMEKLKALINFYTQDSTFNKAGDGSPKNINLKKKGVTEVKKIQIEPMTEIDFAKEEQIKSKAFVIQKYIEKPLLIHSRKFDVRVWVLVTHEMKVFFFKEGYLRTSSETFTMDSAAIGKKNVHLTNNAVQKFSEGYGKFEDGNQLSFAQFQVFSYYDPNIRNILI